MKVAVAAVVAFLLLVGAIVVAAPATLMDRRLASVTRGQLRISDAAGTLWRGSGWLTDVQGTWRIPVGWRVDPLSIARGTLLIELISQDGAGAARGDIELSERTVLLRALAFEAPAQALAILAPPAAHLMLGGLLAIDAPAFEWGGVRGHGTIAARWRGARVKSPIGSVDLGLVDATLAPDGNRLAGRIGNHGGDFRIDGTLFVDGIHFKAEMTIVALPSAPAHIVHMLPLLGPPDANGAVRVAWSGDWR